MITFRFRSGPGRHPILRSIFCAAVPVLGWLGAASSGGATESLPGYVVLPLVPMGGSNQATMRVYVNGQPTMLIVDTGATGTLLNRAFYQAAHVRSNSSAPGEVPAEVGKKFKANGEPAEVGYVDSMKAGGAELGKRPVAVMNLSEAFAQYNNMHKQAAVGGLLGEDVLRQYNAIIDWRRRGVYLNVDPSKRMKLGAGMVAAGWTAVPMSSTNYRHFTVEATVEGKPVRLIVDTGAVFTTFDSGVVPLKHMLYHQDSGLTRVGHMSGTLSMIGGDSTMHAAQVDHWKIGNFEVESSVVASNRVPQEFLDEKSSGNGPVLGFLGCEVLAANNAIVDIAGSTLYLKASSRH